MKAEKAIEIQFDSEFWNPDDEDFKNKIIQAMKTYAKDQIQKDRERVKLNARIKKCIPFIIDNHTYEGYTIDPKSIDQTPIILE